MNEAWAFLGGMVTGLLGGLALAYSRTHDHDDMHVRQDWSDKLNYRDFPDVPKKPRSVKKGPKR